MLSLTRSTPWLLAFLLSAFAAGAASAQDDDDPLAPDDLGSGIAPESIGESLAGKLDFARPDPGRRGPYSLRPESIELTREAPTEFRRVPAWVSNPLFGTLRLGRSGRVYFALDRSDESSEFYDRLYIDANTNRDLTDDAVIVGASVHSEERGRRYTEFSAIEFDLYYGQNTNEPFGFTMYIWYPRAGDPARILLTSASWRQGVIEVEGQRVLVGVFDENSDGMYQEKTCRWSLVPEAAAEELFRPDRTVPAVVPIRVNGKPYRIASIMPEGRRFELVTETESATRRAELSYDPLQSEPIRPQAEDDIPWVGDLDLAMSVARGDGKNVLVLFTVDWARAAQNLAERTLRDKEVVEVMSRDFLCVRLNPDLDVDVAAQYGVVAAPTTLVIDPSDGSVVQRFTGYRAARTYAAALREVR